MGADSMDHAKVSYKYGTNGKKPTVGSSTVLSTEGKTESAVMAALKKKYPDRELIILKIEFM